MNIKNKLTTILLIGLFCGSSFASELETAINSFVNSKMTEMAVIGLAASYHSKSGHWPQGQELKAGIEKLESPAEINTALLSFEWV